MLESIPPLLLQFIMTTAFSFVVGLEFRSYLRINQYQAKVGSTLTFMLIGILGFLLYKLNPEGLFFATGLGILGAMLLVYYWHQSVKQHFSLLEIVLTLLVFLIGPVTVYFPGWFLVLFVVLLVLMLGEKPLIHQFSESLANNEIVTL